MWKSDATAPSESGRCESATTVATTVLRPTEERRVVAWVGKSVLFRGDLISLEDMVIDGRVEGTIELRDHMLTVGPDSRIQADITAKIVRVLGQVVGTITASDRVEIGDAASVEGDILSPRLAMSDGAVVRGHVETGTRRDSSAAHTLAEAVDTAR